MNKHLTDKFSSIKLQPDSETFVKRFVEHLTFCQGKDQYSATPFDCYVSFATVIKDFLLDKWIKTQQAQYVKHSKRVYYLSLEYLIGRSLNNTILNLDLEALCLKELRKMGFDMSMLSELEWDAGLGNGGLGRLAACFLDSMATLKIPAFGYGIRYEYGIFSQSIKDGIQVETPDNWLRYGSVWEIPHQERLFPVYFGGKVEQHHTGKNAFTVEWKHDEYVMAMAYDYLIPGYHNDFVNTLRLWAAKASRDFNLSYFNEGDYIKAVAEKSNTETISKVLYPNDNNMAGKELRFKQEYFFVSATLQDIFRRFNKSDHDYTDFPCKVAIQLNDTHPAIAVADLMRILVDEKKLPWETAWDITKDTIAYTNHTILPEALEKWQVSLFEKVLPRHLQIIYEINRRFLNEISLTPGLTDEDIKQISIIEEGNTKQVKMANLCIIGSHSINGVSQLHSDLLKSKVFPHFYKVLPEQFNNKTNGITPRRWLRLANPELSAFITELIGQTWVYDLNELGNLKSHTGSAQVLDKWTRIKKKNKVRFAQYLKEMHDVYVNPDSIFDFQAKRIHEYKRQLLNALHILHLALHMKETGIYNIQPHTFFFAGKAAPGYYMAKLIIRFICSISEWIEQDTGLSEYLKVVFLPNYRVTLAERIMPAAEVSQQISTAGTEASGTGNMKFSLNGALTVGTLDGANIEIREEAGAENFFLFGMTTEEVATLKVNGYYPYEYLERSPQLKSIVEFIQSDRLNPHEPGLFQPILDALFKQGDAYCIIADFEDYARVMSDINSAYKDKRQWAKKSMYNVAGMGKFSSDNTIRQYTKEIWKV
jgi:starch phosphorylase